MVDDLANLDRRIVMALTALRCARAGTQHSLNSQTRWDEEMSERRLNDLLDQRARYRVSERATALAGATVGPLSSR
jgi:hypothetical protein